MGYEAECVPARIPEGGIVPARIPEGGVSARIPEGGIVPARIPEWGVVPARIPEGGVVSGRIPEGGVARRIPEGGVVPVGIPEGGIVSGRILEGRAMDRLDEPRATVGTPRRDTAGGVAVSGDTAGGGAARRDTAGGDAVSGDTAGGDAARGDTVGGGGRCSSAGLDTSCTVSVGVAGQFFLCRARALNSVGASVWSFPPLNISTLAAAAPLAPGAVAPSVADPLMLSWRAVAARGAAVSYELQVMMMMITRWHE